MRIKNQLLLLTAVSVAFLTACNSTPELRKREGFLTTYNLVQKVDDATMRYSDPVGLGLVKQFILSPVKVTVMEFEGKATTQEQRDAVSDYVRDAMVRALGDKYPFVTEAGPDTAEIRVAITDVYRKGGKLGISLEGEVLDSSNHQIHAAVASAMSKQAYTGAWNNAPVFKETIDGMAKVFRQRLNEAQATQ